MPLKLVLRPDEKVIISGAVIKNGKNTIEFSVENQVPVLREKDILTEPEADTLCKKIYLLIQLMYIDEANLSTYHTKYWELIKTMVKAAPKTILLVDQINELIISNKYYQALKLARRLIEYEKEVLASYAKDK
jgi:flagellar protein FlbT